MLKKSSFLPEQWTGKWWPEEQLSAPIELDTLGRTDFNPVSVLLQAGYLTVAEEAQRSHDLYGDLSAHVRLSPPNKESQRSTLKNFINKVDLSAHWQKLRGEQLRETLAQKQWATVSQMIDNYFRSLPYFDPGGAPKAGERERFFATHLVGLIQSAGCVVIAERAGSIGRADLDVTVPGAKRSDDYRFIVEVKVVDGVAKSERAAEAAIQQIIDRGYPEHGADSGAEATVQVLMASVFDRSTRRLGTLRVVDRSSNEVLFPVVPDV